MTPIIDLPEKTKKILIYIIAMAMLMEMMDASVLNTSLPQMANSLHVGVIQLKIVLTIYFLSLGIFIPVSGWAADCFGEKKTMLFALFLFIASSVACGLSMNLVTLVIFRLLQGIGGAFLMPVGRHILTRVFTGTSRFKAIANVNIIALAALSLGPVIGGTLTSYANWRWIFFINIPFGLSGAYLLYRYLPVLREPSRRAFDFLGFAYIAIFLGTLLFFLDILIDRHIAVYIKIMLLTISISSLIAYLKHTKHHIAPLISTYLFRQPKFRSATIGSFLSRLTLSTTPFLVPLLLQAGYHYNAFESGLLSMPVVFGTLLGMFIMPALLKIYAKKKLLIINTLLLGVIFCSYFFQTIHLSLVTLVFQQCLMGFFSALQMPLMNVDVYDQLDERHMSEGITINSGIIQISGSFGIALAALCMVMVMGKNDLQHRVPLIAFQVVFLVQSIYLFIAIYFFAFKAKKTLTIPA